MNSRKVHSSTNKRNKIIAIIISCVLIVTVGIAVIKVVNKSSNGTSQLDTEKKNNTSIKSNKKSDKSSWNLILVNPWNKLPDDFTVKRTTLKSGHSIDTRAYPDLQKMMDDARKEGLSPLICSSYRTMEKQKSLFNNQVQKWLNNGYSKEKAEKEAAKLSAIPGTSEHQTALALDIVSVNNQRLNEEQENTPEQKWLMENSYKYGFILRYPKNKTDITGINYEPWHYRYVGKQAAKQIFEQKICFEEYLKQN